MEEINPIIPASYAGFSKQREEEQQDKKKRKRLFQEDDSFSTHLDSDLYDNEIFMTLVKKLQQKYKDKDFTED